MADAEDIMTPVKDTNLVDVEIHRDGKVVVQMRPDQLAEFARAYGVPTRRVLAQPTLADADFETGGSQVDLDDVPTRAPSKTEILDWLHATPGTWFNNEIAVSEVKDVSEDQARALLNQKTNGNPTYKITTNAAIREAIKILKNPPYGWSHKPFQKNRSKLKWHCVAPPDQEIPSHPSTLEAVEE